MRELIADEQSEQISDLLRTLRSRGAPQAKWTVDAGRSRKEFFDELKNLLDVHKITDEVALGVLTLSDKLETADHPWFIKRGKSHINVKLKNHEQTTMLGLHPDGLLVKPDKRNESLVPKADVDLYRSKVVGPLRDKAHAREVYEALVEYLGIVRKRLSID